MRRTLTAALIMATAAAQAAGVTVSDGDELAVQAGDRRTTARATGERLQSRDVTLTLTGGVLRGRFLEQPVVLRLGADAVDGQLGAAALTSVLSRKAEAISIDGQLERAPVELVISASRIAGVVGQCTYSLRAAGPSYRGWRDCGGGGVPLEFSLTLPQSLAREPDPTVAAVVVTALAPLAPEDAVKSGISTSRLVLERFGVEFSRPPSPDLAEASAPGAQVTRVVPGSPAAAAGLQPGVLVTQAGLEDVTSAEQLERALLRLEPGQQLTLHTQVPGAAATTYSNVTAPLPRPAM